MLNKLIISSLFISLSVQAVDTCEMKSRQILGKCDSALSACQDLVKVQDDSITHLKEGQKQLEGRLEEETAPLFPWYAWAGAGLILGLVSGYKLSK